MKCLDDIKNGDPIGGPLGVRGTNHIFEVYFSETTLETVLLIDSQHSNELFEAFAGRELNAETAMEMCEWIRANESLLTTAACVE